ncbi:MAG TPA: DUF2306 domain-containing protein [Azospirillaceae bacterium]|nr:DUF2306 domain-containing protein [Azospirillaceae bacterium]
MTATLTYGGGTSPITAGRALKAAATLWFLTAAAGQLVFAAYVAVVYGGAALRGDWEAWNRILPRGLIEGDTAGNTAVVLHLAFAVTITVSGLLQLIPAVRARAPAVHRWTGRAYIATAFVVSLGGLYMVWAPDRGAVGALPNWIAISLNAVLIMACGALALRHARARDFARHRRWALRLFLVVNGVWFIRIGVMLWAVLFQGMDGIGKGFSGPVGIALSFGQFLVPLAVLELYLLAQERGGAVAKSAMAAGLVVLTAGMGAGIVAATLFMWLPKM